MSSRKLERGRHGTKAVNAGDRRQKSESPRRTGGFSEKPGIDAREN